MERNEPSPTSMCEMVLEIFHFEVRNLSNMDVAILLIFSLVFIKYDVTDAMLQDIEKMKVICLKFCRLLEVNK